MKKLLTLCLLVATAFTIQAQEMSFEETVKYINEKIECCSKYPTGIIKATTTGDITFVNERLNLFDLVTDDLIGTPILHDNGISLIDNGTDGHSLYYIYFQISGKDYTNLTAAFVSKADAERVYRALLHLRSKCTKVKDPFDK